MLEYPPLSVTAVKVSVIVPELIEDPTITGAEGLVRALYVEYPVGVEDAFPAPAELTALTLNTYEVPLVNPEITVLNFEPETFGVKVVHDAALSPVY